MPDEKRKINCLIPVSMFEKIEASDYKNTTEAINAALERLMDKNEDDIKCYIDEIEEYKHSIEEYKNNISSLQAENISLKEELAKMRATSEDFERKMKILEENLRKAPDPGEFSKLQGKYEELENHSETLIKELEKAERDKEDLKATYNNYFLQVQTLINQKAIESPGQKKPWYKRIFSS